ncbi:MULTISPECIES: DUF1643 domain-containing protein [unclassified Nostoc]|uniref:DUF1643 domain-containing protein n=1 Tax=unclassified Nostoc TaxID=2593658 RepID=UPI002AD59EC0|nr:DUF1643 domain-containing protein [Nostoc sp. DedQUE03]MDZ7972992.1 DUF1643 domain-containing protein [Nostoc sp. DedQUE03]MDZ8044149.1 DUF1643 domain-containing protein [Nostoc sp. DedQUE02]
MERYADFDTTKKYRYLLGRRWDANLPQVTFVMLNPSTADAEKDDRTLTRCINFAKSWGYGSLEVVNLFAYRATQRADLYITPDPVGSENNCYIQLATKRADSIIVAWGGGKYPKIQNRNKQVLNLIYDKSPYSLGRLTKDGHPRHPVRLAATTERIIFPINSL